MEFLNTTNIDMRFVTSYDSIFLGVPKNISIIYDSNKTNKIMEEIIKNQSLVDFYYDQYLFRTYYI